MKLLLVTSAIVLASNALSIDQQWNMFKRKHGKSYKNYLDERQRYKVFQDNLRAIENHNERHERGEVSFKQGITIFADTTREEFESLLSNVNVNKLGPQNANYEDIADPPTSINWYSHGAVTEPITQFNCGACWAITAAEAVEARVFIKTGKLEKLSPQNVMDCSKAFGSNGCLGGTYQSAFNYIEENGILSEKEYAFNGREERCRKSGGVKLSHYVDIQINYKHIQYFVGKTGPVCAAICATDSMRHYTSGIIDSTFGCANTSEELNHAVLVVGYGKENGKEYWIIKNSWSRFWGEHGFFRLKKGDDNVCGINLLGSFPVL